MKTFILTLFSLMVAVAAITNHNPSGTAELLGPQKGELEHISGLHADTADANAEYIKGYVQNNNFDIYVQYAWSCTDAERARGMTCVDPLQTLRPSTGFWSPRVATNDRSSHTIRVYHDPSAKSVYQVEYCMDPDGNVWYNLSSVDGAPFNPYKRFLAVHDKCPWMYCTPGQGPNGCDWPRHEGVCKAGDVRFYLC